METDGLGASREFGLRLRLERGENGPSAYLLRGTSCVECCVAAPVSEWKRVAEETDRPRTHLPNLVPRHVRSLDIGEERVSEPLVQDTFGNSLVQQGDVTAPSPTSRRLGLRRCPGSFPVAFGQYDRL